MGGRGGWEGGRRGRERGGKKKKEERKKKKKVSEASAARKHVNRIKYSPMTARSARDPTPGSFPHTGSAPGVRPRAARPGRGPSPGQRRCQAAHTRAGGSRVGGECVGWAHPCHLGGIQRASRPGLARVGNRSGASTRAGVGRRRASPLEMPRGGGSSPGEWCPAPRGRPPLRRVPPGPGGRGGAWRQAAAAAQESPGSCHFALTPKSSSRALRAGAGGGQPPGAPRRLRSPAPSLTPEQPGPPRGDAPSCPPPGELAAAGLSPPAHPATAHAGRGEGGRELQGRPGTAQGSAGRAGRGSPAGAHRGSKAAPGLAGQVGERRRHPLPGPLSSASRAPT